MIEESLDQHKEETEQEEAKNQVEIPEILFHAIAGTDHPQTLQVIGFLKSKPITVLIDGGNTHNFIDQTTIARYGLPVEKEAKLEVIVANKERINCLGKCKAVLIKIQRCQIITDFYVFPVAACSLVLGVQWLATLGPIQIDYSKLLMSFKIDGTLHIFQGIKKSSLEPFI